MPTDNKVTASSKVRNNKAKYKTRKNEVSESQLIVSFASLLPPKDGQGRLTFCSMGHSL